MKSQKSQTTLHNPRKINIGKILVMVKTFPRFSAFKGNLY